MGPGVYGGVFRAGPGSSRRAGSEQASSTVGCVKGEWRKVYVGTMFRHNSDFIRYNRAKANREKCPYNYKKRAAVTVTVVDAYTHVPLRHVSGEGE